MGEKMRKSYEVLRTKDEVDANRNCFMGPAAVVAAVGLFAMYVQAWYAALVALPVAFAIAIGPRIISWCLGRKLRSLGYSEVELERANLA